MSNTIDVWRISPLRRAGDVAALRAILPAHELARVERLGDETRQRAAITSRAVLRLLLAHYTHLPANELRLIPGRNGKPFLDDSQNSEGITFNLSDSADMAIVAVARKREVGVDLEQVREVARAVDVAARHFPPEIAAELRAAAREERSRMFLQKWARHEALLKARAASIWNPEGGKVGSGADARSSDHGGKFTVRDLDTGRDYVGAVAAQGDGWSVDLKDYSG